MEPPPITVVMTLFVPPIGGAYGGLSRLQMAKQTIMSWGRHMRHSGGMRLHVANDSVAFSDEDANTLAEDFTAWPHTISHTHGKGLGGALNVGLEEAFKISPLAIYADDSYSLIEDIDLSPWAAVLMKHEDIGAISLMPPRPEVHGGRVAYFHGIRTEAVAGVVFDRVGFAWNGRPTIYHQRFFDAYGFTPEGGTGYEWERDFSHQYNDLPGPAVVQAIIDPWQHVWSVLLGNAAPGWSGDVADVEP